MGGDGTVPGTLSWLFAPLWGNDCKEKGDYTADLQQKASGAIHCESNYNWAVEPRPLQSLEGALYLGKTFSPPGAILHTGEL